MESYIYEKLFETPTTISYLMKKPPDFIYQPGQFITIEIEVKNCDERTNSRNFSLSSSPTENFLMITTKTGVSSIKQTLETDSIGTKVKIKGPFGKFLLNDNLTLPAVFICGGIGITPVRSIIKYATEKKLKKKIILLYSNKTVADITFKKELDELAQNNPNLTIHYTITQAQDDHWNGRIGRIDEKMIRELVPNLDNTEFYAVGPASMVLDMKKLLKSLGISEEKIKSELFTGY